MFGDYFSQRADYSKGLFYSCHHKYLNHDCKSALEAPDDFKSRRALRNIRNTQKREEVVKRSFHIHFSDAKHRDKFRNAANLVVNVINFENIAKELHNAHKQQNSNDKDIWVEKFEAGVKFWVNLETGEVQTSCPILKSRSLRKGSNSSRRNSHSCLLMSNSSSRNTALSSIPSSGEASQNNLLRDSRRESIQYQNLGEGTGALVYDDQEMKEFWSLLDTQSFQ